MTFMTDIRNGMVRIIERDEHEAVASEWARLMQDEADNFESDTRWQDRAEFTAMMNVTVLA